MRFDLNIKYFKFQEKILDFINGVGNVAKFVYDSIPTEEKKTTETILHKAKTDKPIIKKETMPNYMPKEEISSNPKDSENKTKPEEVKKKIEDVKEFSTSTTSKEGNS